MLRKNSFSLPFIHELYLLGTETELAKSNEAVIPILNEEPISPSQLPLPPLLASIPNTLLHPRYRPSLQIPTSLSSDSNTTANASATFNLLQFPPLKKFLDVQSLPQKPTPHLSAFSSIKSKDGEL